MNNKIYSYNKFYINTHNSVKNLPSSMMRWVTALHCLVERQKPKTGRHTPQESAYQKA